MGIPYSREINAAFEQVTPLVASGYEILQTTKNIAWLLLILEICSVVLLLLILLALTGLLFTMNPELEKERHLLVTPAMKWIAGWTITSSEYRASIAGVVVGLFALAGFGFLFYVYWIRNVEDPTIENDVKTGDKGEAPKGGKDVGNVKQGETDQ